MPEPKQPKYIFTKPFSEAFRLWADKKPYKKPSDTEPLGFILFYFEGKVSVLHINDNCLSLYHFHVTQIKRSAGQSAIASAAYRSGEKLYSQYYGETSDYARKSGVICSEILLPSYVPPEYTDRETLMNESFTIHLRHNAPSYRTLQKRIASQTAPNTSTMDGAVQILNARVFRK